MWQELVERFGNFSLSDAQDQSFTDFVDDYETYWGVGRASKGSDVPIDQRIAASKWYDRGNKVAAIGSRLFTERGFGSGKVTEIDLLVEEARQFDSDFRQNVGRLREQNPEAAQAMEDLLDSPHLAPPGQLRIYRVSLEIAAWRLLPDVGSIAPRLERLARIAGQYPGERAAVYLSRVATSYLLGLHFELATMSRAALEIAIEAAGVTETDIRGLLGESPPCGVGLKNAIVYCEQKDILTPELATAARRVKRAGDQAAHGDFEFNPDPDALVADLMAVVKALGSSGH